MNKRLNIILSIVLLLLLLEVIPSKAQIPIKPRFLSAKQFERLSKLEYVRYQYPNFIKVENNYRRLSRPLFIPSLISSNYSPTPFVLKYLKENQKSLYPEIRFGSSKSNRLSHFFDSNSIIDYNDTESPAPIILHPTDKQVHHEENEGKNESIPAIETKEDEKGNKENFNWDDYIFKLIIDYQKESDLDWSNILIYGKEFEVMA